MEKLTPEQMEEVLIVHETAEFDGDLDAVMATLVANPQYELPSIGWHIEGQAGVRELYRRWLQGTETRNVWAEKRVQAFSIDENALIRDAYVYYDGDDGQRVTGRYSTAISFEGGLISGERMFMEAPFAKIMYDILGADFGDVPGVSKLEDVSPPPVARLDRVAAHAANPHH
jgi:hypothetical protein